MPAIMRTSKKAQQIAESIMGLPKNAPRKRNSKSKRRKDLMNTVQGRPNVEADAII